MPPRSGPANLTERLHSAQHHQYRATPAPASLAPRYRGTPRPIVAGAGVRSVRRTRAACRGMSQQRHRPDAWDAWSGDPRHVACADRSAPGNSQAISRDQAAALAPTVTSASLARRRYVATSWKNDGPHLQSGSTSPAGWDNDSAGCGCGTPAASQRLCEGRAPAAGA